MATIPTGRFVWFEHISGDAAKAQGFFGELFGWTKQSMPMPQGGAYTMIAVGTDSIGGYPPAMPGQPAPAHAHWISHLQVADAKASAKQVESLGGKVLSAPLDMGMGTHALVADPLGGVFALWQPAKAEGTGDYKGQTGTFCWNELYTEDPARSAAFYAAIAGFEIEQQEMPGMGTYHVLKSDGKPRAGVVKSPMPGVPQSWLPYVQVTNADATHDKAKRLGGSAKLPPTDIPTVGRFAILADPVGAAIGILQPSQR
jgi:predicted enzyme related to lactoylglutathione lyase